MATGRYRLGIGTSAAGVMLLALCLPGAAQAEACPFLPQYLALRQAVAAVPADDALPALYAYAADPENDNPAACEAFELDWQIGERERALVALVAAGHPPLPPFAVFHCKAPDPRTTRCNGIMADDTDHPSTILPWTIGRWTAHLRSEMPGSHLIAIYITSLGAVFRGWRPRRVDAARPVTITARPGGTILIALFTAPVSAPFRVRKFVWYY